jgi:hypothetical protein
MQQAAGGFMKMGQRPSDDQKQRPGKLLHRNVMRAARWLQPVSGQLKLLGWVSLAAIMVALFSDARTVRLPAAPQVKARDHIVDLTLRAVRDDQGRDRFSFKGRTVPPVIRVSAGDTLKITYINNLPRPSGERCSVGLCQNMTNFHFQGSASRAIRFDGACPCGKDATLARGQ